MSEPEMAPLMYIDGPRFHRDVEGRAVRNGTLIAREGIMLRILFSYFRAEVPPHVLITPSLHSSMHKSR